MTEQIVNEIINRHPSQKNIYNLYQNMDEYEKQSFLSFIEIIKKAYALTESEIIDCYDMLVKDTLEESAYFYRHGSYRYATYHEVDEYMKSKSEHYMRYYQVGILMSLFLWPNHVENRRHFIKTFKEKRGRNYLEVGVGHGYYHSEAVANFSYETFLGIDISEESLNMTRLVLESRAECQHKRHNLELTDFLDFETNQTFDAIVSGEVLEHVEKPREFLTKMAQIANEDTFVYVTTALNSPVIDHIFLFRHPDELYDLFHESGLQITDMEFFSYQTKPFETCIKKKLPVTVAIMAHKL